MPAFACIRIRSAPDLQSDTAKLENADGKELLLGEAERNHLESVGRTEEPGALSTVASLLLVAMPGAPSSVLLHY